MKKILSLVVLMAMLMSILTSCIAPLSPSGDSGDTTETTTADNTNNNPDITDPDGNKEPPDENDSSTNTENKNPDPVEYTYINFTPSEKQMFTTLLGEEIPFLPNNEYYVEAYAESGENGIHFYTVGNVEADFTAYLTLFSSYDPIDTSVSDGVTWHTYQKGEFFVDMAFSTSDGTAYIDIYAYLPVSVGGDYLYTDFTSDEKQSFINLFGEVIPFLPNDEYYVDLYEDELLINFYTFGNTEEEFEAYMDIFSDYTFIETYIDDFGDTCYLYQKDDIVVDFCFYVTDDSATCVDIYIYLDTQSGGNGGEGGGNTGEGEHLYTEFTPEEQDALIDLVGEVIPFLPNSGYEIDTTTYEGEFAFYAVGNTPAEYEAYRQTLVGAGYALVDTYVDSEYGDTWYTYQKGNIYIDMTFYAYSGDNYLELYAYLYTGSGEDGGNTGGEGGGNTGDVDLITNDGQGLPLGNNGVYDVDFTDATYVKDVTDQGYYLDGCPTVGSPAVLVIPVEFSDLTAANCGYSISTIKSAFLMGGQNNYLSVYDYYLASSYGQLTLDITVLDTWFRPKYNSSYYANATIDYYGDQVPGGDQLIIDEALAYLATIMDLSQFDSDNNGTIDAIVLINTLEIGDDDFHWAYRYWNVYADENDEYYEYDGVYANDYIWASYQFLYEGFDADGNISYDYTDRISTYTYIHEFGHILGADDYYDTSGLGSPMDGCDVMDSMPGDHSAYTKFNFGWLTTSRLVTTDTSVTLTLEAFSKNGDTIILANNWDPTLGAYQEYYIIVYYQSVGLNTGEGGYFSRDGIVVYHINASLYRETFEGETYYDVYYNNTDASDETGTSENLIEYVKSDEGNYTYVAGNYLPSVTDDGGNALIYSFTVDALTEDTATLTFTKLA